MVSDTNSGGDLVVVIWPLQTFIAVPRVFQGQLDGGVKLQHLVEHLYRFLLIGPYDEVLNVP